MSKYEKLLIVLLMGSLWGALELFGGDLFRSLGVPNKSAYLFGLGLIILYASKRLGGFAGSVVLMALICGLFKTASSSFYPCQFAAVMINGIVFDASYQLFKNHLNSSVTYRSVAAPVIAFISFALFAFAAVYLIREPNWAARGMSGIVDYLTLDALIAALVSIVTIHLGFYLGGVFRSAFGERKIGVATPIFRVASLTVVAAIWIAGQLY